MALEESVSITRQVEACSKYAESRGWTLELDPFVDEGVSATYSRPEDRPGWRALVATASAIDVVIVWKVDRLARRVLDFLHADEALRDRGAALVAVEDPVDMTTPQGRAFATMLAVFGEMESAATRARVKAARDYLIRAGRIVGGTVPYGWRKVPNPEGPGYVLAQDSERIEYVRGMAHRVIAGQTIYSVVKWLNEVEAPLPRASQKNRKTDEWAYSTVERLLRSPVLAGMTPYQPGRRRHDAHDPTAVLRGEDGLPVVDESVAILTTEERRSLVAALDTRESPQSRPRASKGTTSPLLSGLVTCGPCGGQRMHRGTTQGRPSLSCPKCHQTISRNQLDTHITTRLMNERGAHPDLVITRVPQSNSVDVADIEQAIQDISLQMTRPDVDASALVERLNALKQSRAEARRFYPYLDTYSIAARTVQEAWDSAESDLERRKVIASQVERIEIVRGKGGRYLDPGRVKIVWRVTGGERSGDH